MAHPAPSDTSAPPAPAPAAPHPLLAEYYATEAERRQRVRRWFDGAAADYDWVSQGLSFGSGHWYRRRVLRLAGVGPGTRLVDVACGTGVITEAAQRLVGSDGCAVGLDPSGGMILHARRRGVRRLSRGFAEGLPFADESFDVLTMGYALRHVADLVQVFREYHRVLVPGGRALILEITPPTSRLGRALLKAHMRYVVPGVARIGSRRRETADVFRYFWDTIEACVPAARIVEALREAGFSKAERRIDLGIFSTYEAVR